MVYFLTGPNSQRPNLTENEELILKTMEREKFHLNVKGKNDSGYTLSTIISMERTVWHGVLKRIKERENPNTNEIQYVEERLDELDD